MNFTDNLYLAADADGFGLKEKIKFFLDMMVVNYTDLGIFSANEVGEGLDYVYLAREVAEKIFETRGGGIIISDTGIGLCMVANEKQGIRAALVTNPTMAMLARKNNNANLLCLGSDFCTENEAKEIVEVFMTTDFDVAKHQKYVEKYDQI